jgi:tartrate-resistant acid phosphatase type 5
MDDSNAFSFCPDYHDSRFLDSATILPAITTMTIPSASTTATLLLLLIVAALSITSTTNAVRLVSMGDWGDEKNLESSRVNEFIASELANGVLLLGDNFYETGVTSVQDSQFTTKFQQPFRNVLHTTKFYACAGNRDWYGNVTAQIEYTKHDPTKRWNFPSLYYTQMFNEGGVRVLVVFVDTWTLQGGDAILAHNAETGEFAYDPVKLQQAVREGEINENTAQVLQQRFKPQPPGGFDREQDQAQADWLQQVFSSNQALSSDWILVAGHMPIRSASSDDFLAGDRLESLDIILRENNVNAYMSGYDHLLQHIYLGGSVNYFGSGAGARNDTAISSKSVQGLKAYSAGKFGYTVQQFTKTTMTTKFVVSENGEKKTVYSVTVSKARRNLRRRVKSA